MLNISKKAENDALVVALEGRLDTSTAPDLEGFLDAEAAGTDALVLDLEKLEYTSSAGLRVLLKFQKIMSAKKGMTLKNVNDEIMEVFDITGFGTG